MKHLWQLSGATLDFKAGKIKFTCKAVVFVLNIQETMR